MRRMQPEDLPHFTEAQEGLVRHFGLVRVPARAGRGHQLACSSGRNTVVVMPTGAGKSLCYQLPATLLPGVTLVVSPLIALMKDQVEQLSARGHPGHLHQLHAHGRWSGRSGCSGCASGEYKLVYVAPERFRSPSFLEALARGGRGPARGGRGALHLAVGPRLPARLRAAGQVRKRLRPPRTVALTATATPEVRDDIVRVAADEGPRRSSSPGFDRPNLFLEVVRGRGRRGARRRACAARARGRQRHHLLLHPQVRREPARRAAEARRASAVLYHAGMEDDARRARAGRSSWPPKDAVAVATNAFGMGIDKPDIRFVVHADIPRAVEAYYQEIGRAGRDGKPAHAVLLFNHADVFTQERLIEGNHPPEARVRRRVERAPQDVRDLRPGRRSAGGAGRRHRVRGLRRAADPRARRARSSAAAAGEGDYGSRSRERADGRPARTRRGARRLLAALLERVRPGAGRCAPDLQPLVARRAGLAEDEVRHALDAAGEGGALSSVQQAVRRARHPRAASRCPSASWACDLAAVREQERRALLLLKRMTDYAYTQRCRRAFMLRYFGEEERRGDCGDCDVCAGQRGCAACAPRGPRARPSARQRPSATASSPPTELRRWRTRAGRRTWRRRRSSSSTTRRCCALATALPMDRDEFLAVKGTGESQLGALRPEGGGDLPDGPRRGPRARGRAGGTGERRTARPEPPPTPGALAPSSCARYSTRRRLPIERRPPGTPARR